MIPTLIDGANQKFVQPDAWPEGELPCETLVVKAEQAESGLITMRSAWFPTRDERIRIGQGAPVYLTIVGTAHPPVRIEVGQPGDEK